MVGTLLCWKWRSLYCCISFKELKKYKASLGNVWWHNNYRLLVIAGVKCANIFKPNWYHVSDAQKKLCYFKLGKRQIIFHIRCSPVSRRSKKKIQPHFNIDPALSDHIILQTKWHCHYVFVFTYFTITSVRHFSFAKTNTFRYPCVYP